MNTRSRLEPIGAFVLASLLFLAVHDYYDVRQFTFDAQEYWNQALLSAPGQRGYLYPLLLSPARLAGLHFDNAPFLPFRLLSSVAYAAVLTLVLPFMFVRMFGGRVTFVRRLVPPLFVAIVFPGVLLYPMSDLPALLLCWSAMMLLADPRVTVSGAALRPVLLAGVLMGAAYNTRSIYLFSMVMVAVWMARRPRALAAFLAGFVLICLPQAVLNKQLHGVWSLNPSPTANLFAFQLFKGLEIQRYETAAAPAGVNSGVPYIDEAGQAILAKPGVDNRDLSVSNYLSILARYPMDVLGVYGRHFVNGLDVRDGRLYVTRQSSTRGHMGLLSFLLLALAVWSALACTAGRWQAGGSAASPQWQLWAGALLVPVLAITPGAVETRFFLPLHLLAYCAVAFLTVPAALGDSFRRRHLVIIVSFIAALCIFSAISLSTMA